MWYNGIIPDRASASTHPHYPLPGGFAMSSETSPWHHHARNAFDQLFLHDCVISSFTLEDGDLALSLDEGFQALAGTACNPGSKTVRTSPSQLRFRGVVTLFDLDCRRELCLFGHTCLLL